MGIYFLFAYTNDGHLLYKGTDKVRYLAELTRQVPVGGTVTERYYVPNGNEIHYSEYVAVRAGPADLRMRFVRNEVIARSDLRRRIDARKKALGL